MKLSARMILMATLISLSVACAKSPEKVLIGTWTFSSYISPAEMAKKSDDPIPEGVSVEASVTGTTTYHVGYKYNEEGETTLRIRSGGRELALRFYVREAGVWAIHGDVLVETSGDSTITALDETTKQFLESSPEFKAIISPVKGESTSYQLRDVSTSKIILEEKESAITIVLQRKS